MSKPAIFRKVAASLWRDSGDPSVYGFIELDITDLKDKIMVLPLVIKAVNQTVLANPELTTMLKWGRIAPRKDKSISVMVNIQGSQNDLSFLNLSVSHDLTVEAIKKAILEKSGLIRALKDPHLGSILQIIRFLPKWLLKTSLWIYTFLIYELDTRLGLRFLPHRPFGSVIVSNVGSLGIKKALLPLVPLARASMMISIGQSGSEVKVFQEKICIREIIHIGITFDHRLFDGSHAAKMLADFDRSFYSHLRDQAS